MINETQSARLLALLDKEDIRALRLRYSELLDGGNVEQLDEVFTADAEVKVTVGSMQGLPAIKQSLKAAYHDFDSKNREHYPFMHAVTNHQVTLSSESTAAGSCYLLDFVTDRPANEHPVLLLGRYIDRYVKMNGEWRIEHTELDVVWPDNV